MILSFLFFFLFLMVTVQGQFITLLSSLKGLSFKQGNSMLISPAIRLAMRLNSSNINENEAEVRGIENQFIYFPTQHSEADTES